MHRSIGRARVIALAGLALAGQAQAQAVHKCIVNGAAVYQTAACPAANDSKSLVIPPPPSQQELLDATANGRLQSVQPGATTTTAPAATVQRRYGRTRATMSELTPSQQERQSMPASNCEQLNQSYQEAKYRHDELAAPGTGANRSAALQRAIDDMKRVQDQAANSQCRLR
jgi:hypothetical protein